MKQCRPIIIASMSLLYFLLSRRSVNVDCTCTIIVYFTWIVLYLSVSDVCAVHETLCNLYTKIYHKLTVKQDNNRRK